MLAPAPPSSTTFAESGPTISTPLRSSSSDPSFMTRHLVDGYRVVRYRAALDTAVNISGTSTSIPSSVSVPAISRRDFDEVLVTRPKPIPSFRSHLSVSAAPGKALQDIVRTPSISSRTVLAIHQNTFGGVETRCPKRTDPIVPPMVAAKATASRL